MNVYCVILCRLTHVRPEGPRIKRLYLGADSAEGALLTAASENPQWQAVGVEPRVFFAAPTQADHASPQPDTVHAA